MSEDDDVLETLGPANDTRRAVGIARVVDEASCWIDWARKKERDNGEEHRRGKRGGRDWVRLL